MPFDSTPSDLLICLYTRLDPSFLWIKKGHSYVNQSETYRHYSDRHPMLRR